MKQIILVLSSFFPSALRVAILRAMGAKIGKNVKFGLFSIVLYRDYLSIGTGSKFGSFSLVKCNSVDIGAHTEIASAVMICAPKVKIGCDCKISYLSIIRSGHTTTRSELIIGDLVHIFPFVMVDCSRKVEIDDGTGVGPKCSIFTHSSYKSVLEGYSVTYADVYIGKKVELTYNVFVAPGVRIGNDAICAYGAYVNKDVLPGMLVAGMPAIPKRSREQITNSGEHLDPGQLLNAIIEDYRQNIETNTGRKPIKTELSIDIGALVIKENAAYVLIGTTIKRTDSANYAIFDITNGVCQNHGLALKDFNGFRKYLSRYGIRFISGEED